MVTLPEGELRVRARRVALVVTDVDGVLTDGTVFYSEVGEAYKQFSMRDGMGVERLRQVGIDTAFLTREKTGFAAARAAKLGIVRVYAGVRDKQAHLPTIASQCGQPVSAFAYIGDDVNDVDAMRAVVDAGGLAAVPADALEPARRVAVYAAQARGGQGAFREFAEWILHLRGEGDP
jgi:3-deoxy-D-manno-octulosonate 8-phosphate phosphatase (KDO 8-P phosphatase)